MPVIVLADWKNAMPVAMSRVSLSMTPRDANNRHRFGNASEQAQERLTFLDGYERIKFRPAQDIYQFHQRATRRQHAILGGRQTKRGGGNRVRHRQSADQYVRVGHDVQPFSHSAN